MHLHYFIDEDNPNPNPNPPQAGKFKNMREAWAWQRVHGGGLRGLYGIAAIYRALFIAQAILTINFARGGVEQFLS